MIYIHPPYDSQETLRGIYCGQLLPYIIQVLQHFFFSSWTLLCESFNAIPSPFLNLLFSLACKSSLARDVNAFTTSTPSLALVQKQRFVSSCVFSSSIYYFVGLLSLSTSHLFPISITLQQGYLFSSISCLQLSLTSLNDAGSFKSNKMTMESAPLQQAEMMVRKVSCPAVSQICILTFFPSTSMVRNLKSTPMVARRSPLNWSSTNLTSRDDLPTPELPTRTTLNSQSQLFFINMITGIARIPLNCLNQTRWLWLKAGNRYQWGLYPQLEHPPLLSTATLLLDYEIISLKAQAINDQESFQSCREVHRREPLPHTLLFEVRGALALCQTAILTQKIATPTVPEIFHFQQEDNSQGSEKPRGQQSTADIECRSLKQGRPPIQQNQV